MYKLEKKRNCFICQESIDFSIEWKIKCPDCRSNFHMKCMEGSAFLKSRKEIYCPVCTDPDGNKGDKRHREEDEDEERAKDIKNSNTFDLDKRNVWKKDWESHASEKVASLKHKVKHKMKRVGGGGGGGIITRKKAFGKKWNRVAKNNDDDDEEGQDTMKMYKEITLFLLNQIKPSTRYDTLTGLGWTIPDIYFGISCSFKDLCEMGFSMNHIINDESQIEPLVTLYAFDVASMKQGFGSRSVSIQKVKNLSSFALKRLGFTTHRLCCMGLKKGNIASFKRVKMCEWIEDLKLFPIHIKLLNVKREDFSSIFMDCTPPWDYSIVKSKMIQLVDDEKDNSSTKRKYLCTFLKKSNGKKKASLPSTSPPSCFVNPLATVSSFRHGNYIQDGYIVPNSYFPYGNIYVSDYIHDYYHHRHRHHHNLYHQYIQQPRKKFHKVYTLPHPKTLLAISEKQLKKRAKKQTSKKNPQKPSTRKKPSSISKPQMSKDTFKITTPLSDNVATITNATAKDKMN